MPVFARRCPVEQIDIAGQFGRVDDHPGVEASDIVDISAVQRVATRQNDGPYPPLNQLYIENAITEILRR